MAGEGDFAPLPGKEIARECGLPLDYLLKVLKQLVAAGLLLSFRGPSGGFKLAKKPDTVSLLEVIEAVEGPFEADDREMPEQFEGVAKRLMGYYQEATRQSREYLGGVMLRDLV